VWVGWLIGSEAAAPSLPLLSCAATRREEGRKKGKRQKKRQQQPPRPPHRPTSLPPAPLWFNPNNSIHRPPRWNVHHHFACAPKPQQQRERPSPSPSQSTHQKMAIGTTAGPSPPSTPLGAAVAAFPSTRDEAGEGEAAGGGAMVVVAEGGGGWDDDDDDVLPEDRGAVAVCVILCGCCCCCCCWWWWWWWWWLCLCRGGEAGSVDSGGARVSAHSSLAGWRNHA
jgi:hypothetical protein